MKQPFLNGPVSDSLLIAGPAFFSVAVVALFPDFFQSSTEMPDYVWAILVVFVDVAHVYSTLFRTYFDKEARMKHHKLLTAVPLLSFVAAVLVYSSGSLIFWRCMAYLAVYHFIRQQYGFMKLYSVRDKKYGLKSKLDVLMIYSACAYPILYWHLSADRDFHWFVKGDFFLLPAVRLIPVFGTLYILIIAFYVFTELQNYFKEGYLNLPKNLIVAGTALSWYMGIVYYNSDMAFTALNVIAHGVPYMALVWFKARKKYKSSSEAYGQLAKMAFGQLGVPVFLFVIFILAYTEEGLWDGLVWKDHEELFGLFSSMPAVTGFEWLCLLVPLLSLPQITHYVLDGYIWKSSFEK